MIPPKTTALIHEAAKIEEVVQDFVQLRRRGVNMVGLCPFHNEKTPSFYVAPHKNLFKCFGCGKAGDPTRFVMEHENMSYPDALRYLARKYGITVEEVELTPEMKLEMEHKQQLNVLNQYAAGFFQEQLWETDSGKSIGLGYFKERGFREETIRQFGLGYAPDRSDVLLQLARKQGHDVGLMKELGLVSQHDRDFFRNRVMFPIHNLTGQVIGFAGRIMQKDVKAPKYVNSPESEVYYKSKILYGMYFAQKAIRQLDECILVEGYTDVISLHQAGIHNVVASSGTSLTVEQIALIKRFTKNVKILYDGDPAGIRAALRGLDLVLEQDMNVRIVLLPDKEDPDSYLHKVGAGVFQEFLQNNSEDFIRFKAHLLLQDAAKDPVKKAALVKDMVGSIARIPDPIRRSIYIRECAQMVQLEEQVLVNEMNKEVHQLLKRKRTPAAPVRDEDEGWMPESEMPMLSPDFPTKSATFTSKVSYIEYDFIRVLICFGAEKYSEENNISVANFILQNTEEEVLESFENKLYQKIVNEIKELLENGNSFNQKMLINHSDEKISEIAIDFLTKPDEYSPNWKDRHNIELRSQKYPNENFIADCEKMLPRFRLNKIEKILSENQQVIADLAARPDKYNEMITRIKVQMKLKSVHDELAMKYGSPIQNGSSFKF